MVSAALSEGAIYAWKAKDKRSLIVGFVHVGWRAAV
jgi:hypothetical protein